MMTILMIMLNKMMVMVVIMMMMVTLVTLVVIRLNSGEPAPGRPEKDMKSAASVQRKRLGCLPAAADQDLDLEAP